MTLPAVDALTDSQVCRVVPGVCGSGRVCPQTVARWIVWWCPALDGTRVRLWATRAGGRWLVQPANLVAFFTALATTRPPAA